MMAVVMVAAAVPTEVRAVVYGTLATCLGNHPESAHGLKPHNSEMGQPVLFTQKETEAQRN